MKKYPVANPNMEGNELKYVTDAVKSSMVSWHGKYVKMFEEQHAKRHGYKYGISTTSGTTALTLALAALDIKEGDEVIVPEFTMVATAWAATYNNAKLVFVDCNDELVIDTEKIRAAITPKTKAIMPVWIYGREPDMKEIEKIADDFNLKIVADMALAHGIDATGDIACYALFGNKILMSGEGGICLTNDERLYKRLDYLRNMAFDPRHTFLHKELGFNFRYTSLQAAVALAQLERLDDFLEKRKQIEKWYDEELKGVKEITIMPERRVVWVYDILAEKKQELIDYLEKEGIETRHYFKPMSMQKMYYDPNFVNLKAYDYSLKGMYLPTYMDLTQEDVKHICNKIKEFYNK
jgi:perosamine synthetase